LKKEGQQERLVGKEKGGKGGRLFREKGSGGKGWI